MVKQSTSAANSGQAAPKKRSCLSTFFTCSIGCLAFFGGSVIAVILFLPRVAGAVMPGVIEDGFDETFEGSIAVGDIDLAWGGEQELRDVVIFDPEGREVVRATVRTPSLLDLFDQGLRRWGSIEVELSAALVANDEGVTNLQRAFEARPGHKVQSSSSDADDIDVRLTTQYDIDVTVRGRRITWSDARTRERGAPAEVHGLEAVFTARSGEPVAISARATVASDVPGELELEATLAGPQDPETGLAFGTIRAQATATDLPVAMVDGLAGLSGQLVEMLGERTSFTLDVQRDAAANSARVALDLNTDAERRVVVNAELADGAWRSSQWPGLKLSIGEPRGLLTELAADHLPDDAELVWDAERHGAWTAQIGEFHVPWPAGPKTLDDLSWVAGLEGLRGQLDAELPGSSYYTDESTRAAGTILGVHGVVISVRAEPGPAEENVTLAASIYGSTDTGIPGDVQLDLAAHDLWASIGAGRGLGPARLDLQVRNASPTLVDDGLGLDGCFASLIEGGIGFRAIVDDHGDRMELQGLLRTSGLSANLHAFVGDTQFELHEDGLYVAARPAPGWFERCVATRMGMEGRIAYLPGDDPIALRGSKLTFPLPDPAANDDWLADTVRAATGALVVDLGSWRFVHDEMTLGTSFLQLEADLTAGEPLVARATADLDQAGTAAGRLAAEVTVPDPGLAAAGDLTGLDAEARVEGLEPEAVEAILRPLLPDVQVRFGPDVGARVFDLFSPRMRVTAEVAGLSVTNASATYAFDELTVIVEPGTAGGDLALNATSDFEAIWANGARLARPKAAPRVAWDVSLPEGEADEAGFRALGCRIAAPQLVWEDGSGAHDELSSVELHLDVDAHHRATGRLALEVLAPAESGAGGSLSADLRVLDDLALLQEPEGSDRIRVGFDVTGRGLPTSLLDVLLEADGLLVDVFGRRVDLSATSAGISRETGAFEAEVTAPGARVTARGEVVEGRLVTAVDDGLVAHVPLSPLFSKRIVGSLVPLIVDVRAAEGAPPVALTVRSLALPLDGGLAGLDASVRLDLGEVVYRLLPEIQGSFLDDVTRERTQRLAPMELSIEKGVARYQGLAFELGGHRLSFDGTCSLVDGKIELAGDVPLAALGKDVSRALGEASRYLGKDLDVPVVISGSTSRPRVRLAEGFGERALEDAAGDLLKRLLGDD